MKNFIGIDKIDIENMSSRLEPNRVKEQLNIQIWHILRRLDVMPVKIHKVQKEILDVVCWSNEKLNEICLPECSCSSNVIFQKGCQCGGI